MDFSKHGRYLAYSCSHNSKSSVVKIPCRMGILNSNEIFTIALVTSLQIKSYCEVSPRITHPNAIIASILLGFATILPS